jgi:hypothetical protein
MKDLKETPFTKDLMRNFKQLKESRAESVAEDLEILYKRKIEDLCHKIRSYDRDRENIILDLSPTSITSAAVVPSDFKPENFLRKDVEIGINRRSAVIELEIVVSRYNELFGEYEDMASVNKWMKGETASESEIINETEEE